MKILEKTHVWVDSFGNGELKMTKSNRDRLCKFIQLIVIFNFIHHYLLSIKRDKCCNLVD